MSPENPWVVEGLGTSLFRTKSGVSVLLVSTFMFAYCSCDGIFDNFYESILYTGLQQGLAWLLLWGRSGVWATCRNDGTRGKGLLRGARHLCGAVRVGGGSGERAWHAIHAHV